MSSDVLVLGAMVVTVLATAWWSLTPASTDSEDRAYRMDDLYDADAA